MSASVCPRGALDRSELDGPTNLHVQGPAPGPSAPGLATTVAVPAASIVSALCHLQQLEENYS